MVTHELRSRFTHAFGNALHARILNLVTFSGVLSGEAVKFTPELQQLMKFVRHALRHETFNYDHLSTARLVYRHGAIAYLAQSC